MKGTIVMSDEKEFLKNYNMEKYERPSVAADIAVFTAADVPDDNYRKLAEKSLKLLMIRRGRPPFEGFYALPGGFAMKNEDLDETAARELFEETGVKDIDLSQLKTTSTPQRDPRGWIISAAYIALVDSSRLEVRYGDDAADAGWFDVSFYEKEHNVTSSADGSSCSETVFRLELRSGDVLLTAEVSVKNTAKISGRSRSIKIISSEGIAFDHAEIIVYAILELRRRTAEEGAAFNLLPEKFTMTDLQRVYEIIMGTKEIDANFRRKMSGFVKNTDEMAQGGGHRPSKLYVRNMEAFLK